MFNTHTVVIREKAGTNYSHRTSQRKESLKIISVSSCIETAKPASYICT